MNPILQIRNWIRTNGQMSEDGKSITYDCKQLEQAISEALKINQANGSLVDNEHEVLHYFYYIGAADGIAKSLSKDGGNPDFNKRLTEFKNSLPQIDIKKNTLPDDEKVLICNNCKKIWIAPKEKCDCGCSTLTETHKSNKQFASNAKFVIMTENNKYIGIDSASGGYPYETERIQDAKIWLEKEDAYDYKLKFPKENWTLHTLMIRTIPTRWF